MCRRGTTRVCVELPTGDEKLSRCPELSLFPPGAPDPSKSAGRGRDQGWGSHTRGRANKCAASKSRANPDETERQTAPRQPAPHPQSEPTVSSERSETFLSVAFNKAQLSLINITEGDSVAPTAILFHTHSNSCAFFFPSLLNGSSHQSEAQVFSGCQLL